MQCHWKIINGDNIKKSERINIDIVKNGNRGSKLKSKPYKQNNCNKNKKLNKILVQLVKTCLHEKTGFVW